MINATDTTQNCKNTMQQFNNIISYDEAYPHVPGHSCFDHHYGDNYLLTPKKLSEETGGLLQIASCRAGENSI